MDGFRPKLLVVRPLRTGKKFNISAALFRQHIYILATLLGLSLPYRIWFGKHCDEIRVTIVKETSSVDGSNKEGEAAEGKSSWFRSKWGRGSKSVTVDSKRAQELFRKSMQAYSLYEEEPAVFGSNPTPAVQSNDNNLVHENAPIQSEQRLDLKDETPLENPTVESGPTTQDASQISTEEMDNQNNEVLESISEGSATDGPPGNC